MKKTIIIVIVLLVVLGIVSFMGPKGSFKNNDKFVIGAILPLSGPTAAFGEQFVVGANIALADLDPNHAIELKTEDSQGAAAAGISAFNKLSSEGVDIMVANLSRVALPLRDLAKEKKLPYMMSLVSSSEALTADNPYTLRLFPSTITEAHTHIKTILSNKWKNVGIIYVNDEFGTSFNKELSKVLDENGIKHSSEGFASDVNDYRTIIGKIKTSKPDGVVFISIPPASLLNFIKQSAETKLNVPIIDGAGILPGVGGLKTLGAAAEGVYTFAGPFDLGQTGASLADALKQKNIASSYAAAYAYDVIKYIVEAKTLAKTNNITILEALHSIKEFNGMEGTYTITGSDIQPNLVPVQVKGGSFVEVK